MKQAFAIIADFVNIKIASKQEFYAPGLPNRTGVFGYVNNLEHGRDQDR
jgi:hypothetical protein